MVRIDRRRLVAVLLLIAALAPTLWLAEPAPPADWRNRLAITPIAAERPESWPAALNIAGAWRLDSGNALFGGYSALIATPGEPLLAFSDQGASLTFAPPPRDPHPPIFTKIPADPAWGYLPQDIESATSDPATGTIWLGYEAWLGIRRFTFGARAPVTVRPAQMAQWPENGGPEAMVRLADGRFIVLAERAATFSRQGGPGLLFPGDPADGAEPVEFAFPTSDGFQPTDMAQLPDGRVLILLRAVRFGWPLFAARLVLADPAAIEAGEAWPWQVFAELESPLPVDNYEALAVEPRPNGGVTIWIMSDDNSAVLQRTVLLQLLWRPDA